MTLQELAEKKTSEYMSGCPKNLMGFIIAKNMFIKGFNEATAWYDMEIAPKDGTPIMVWRKPSDIPIIVKWEDEYNSWSIVHDSDSGNIFDAIKWAHIPLYKN